MKLSTKGRYAIMAMMELAVNRDTGPLPLVEIARRENISLSYLEQLFARLRERKLVKGRRGPGGGFTLSRSPEEITIAEIISAVDGDGAHASAHMIESLPDTPQFLSKRLWTRLSRDLHDFLNGLTLACYVEQPKPRQGAAARPRQAEPQDYDQSAA